MPGKLINRLLIGVIESPLYPLVGTRFAVIRVEGRKTGRTYATPINVDRLGDGWMATSLKTRTWWRNLRDGKHARLTVGGKRFTVVGEVDEETGAVRAALIAYFGRHPKESRYYGVRAGANGRVLEADVERVAAGRVVIHLRPV